MFPAFFVLEYALAYLVSIFVDPKAIHLFGSRGAPNLESISVLRQRARGYYFVASVMLGLFFFDAILPISIF